MKTQNLLKLILIILIVILLATLIALTIRTIVEKEKLLRQSLILPTPYSLEIKNDHTVYLTNSNDTIMMHFENAYALSEESIVFIKRK